MKKKWWMTLGLVAAVVGLAACQTNEKDSTVAKQDASWEKVEERGRLIVATSGTLFPASYYNDKNELTGYDVEVAKEVANRLKLDIEFQEYNVDGMLASVEKGMTDLVANDFGMSEERSKKFALSIPIKYSFDSMIVRKEDNSGIASLEDLKGKKAAGEATTGYMKLAEKMGAELVSYDNATNDQYLTDVANGRTDVILNDYYLQKMSVAALPDIPVKILEDVYFNPSSSGFFYPKQNVALREKIDTVLEEMQADGSLKKLSETFFNADVSVEPDVKVDKTVTID
ncbi:amino acid ABC transporter substrate-binding protein [Vagococcus lutrae]|uniref:transporter substrate-binding domain-containing protein n=1 Tax=Vagococcus lutrae TaxID=81947 RepID=UPI000F85F5B8|nr:transporter substrate-binding domain-containing protein [Vagococcus lutrae]RST93774.1 ABC transporter substrate-binding protein [Vagococcus lutrae]GEQ62397.1 amino acid ABC transporter substrate-binding protein [Vagococcus lutrae]GEQ64303.1 amino acid ABC transporter substrate-binding protein [Vagococcus lutrae]GEQ66194.1 amino acid ABC transporter substrate-binding protein [Vagococcus lutrae]